MDFLRARRPSGRGDGQEIREIIGGQPQQEIRRHAARAALELERTLQIQHHLDDGDDEERSDEDGDVESEIAREEVTREDPHDRKLALRVLGGSARVEGTLRRPVVTIGNALIQAKCGTLKLPAP